MTGIGGTGYKAPSAAKKQQIMKNQSQAAKQIGAAAGAASQQKKVGGGAGPPQQGGKGVQGGKVSGIGGTGYKSPVAAKKAAMAKK